MKKWIRWEGILAFIAVIGLAVIFWVALLDGYVRRGIERTVAFAVGAEVNVDEVDLMLSPLGFIVARIQVTNPEHPATNAVEIQRAAFTLDTVHLFLRKIIIDEMKLEGVALGTPRERPGLVYRQRAEEVPGEGGRKLLWFTIPDISREDIRRAIEAANLETLKSIQDLHRDADEKNRFWQTRIDELPNKDRIDGYRERIEALRQARGRDIRGYLERGAQVRELYSDINSDLGLLKDSYQRFQEDYRALGTQLGRMTGLPAQDAQRIARKFAPSPENIGSASAILFGEQVGAWVERSLKWHQRISPLIERTSLEKQQQERRPPRTEGIDVRFPEHAPMPDFLIRTAAASITTRGRALTGTISNITPDQDILKIPLTFLFSGENLGILDGIRFEGSFDHIDPRAPMDTVQLSLKGYRLQEKALGPEILGVTLKEGVLDTGIKASISPGSLRAELDGAARAVDFLVSGSGQATELQSAFAEAFSRIRSFTFGASVSGAPGDYDLSLSSSLDQVFRGVAESFVRDQAARFEAQLKARLEQEAKEPLESLQARVSALESIGGELSSRISLTEALLESGVFDLGGGT
ncbi:MAG: TIGR03545 family protein [Desulfomonilia bacterium]